MQTYGSSVVPMIEANYEMFTVVEKTIADFFISNEKEMDFSSGRMAKMLHVSEASLSRFAKKMGYKMQFKSMGFDALIPALQSKDIDMIASGLSATPEREKAVLFSNPYFEKGGFVAIVKKDDTATSMNDLAGKRIVVQIGSVALDVAEKIPNAQVKSVDSNSQLFNELKAGTADAIVLDNAVALYYLKQGADADTKIIGEPVDPEPFVWAFRKDDKQLKEQADKALADLKADGTYDKIYEKWFGPAKK